MGASTIRGFNSISCSQEGQQLAKSLRSKMSITDHYSFTVLLKAANDFLLFLKEAKPFHIGPPLVLILVEGAPLTAPYIILSQCWRSISDVIRLKTAFPAMQIRDLIALKPERLVLYEMVARLVLEASLPGAEIDQEIAGLSQSLTREFLSTNPNFATEMLEERTKLETAILQYLDNSALKTLLTSIVTYYFLWSTVFFYQLF
jgi:hypothetical protein